LAGTGCRMAGRGFIGRTGGRSLADRTGPFDADRPG
jgi:hypothetical protein